MNPYNIINFIASKRPEKYSKEKIYKISKLLPIPIDNAYEDQNGLQGQWKKNNEISIYENGIKNGSSITIYDSGKINSKGEYINGQKNGEWIHYDRYTGNLTSKGEYLNDRKIGIWEQYYSNKKPKSKGEYLNNRKIGIWEEYDTNGDLSAKGEYLKGYQHGQWEYYHPNTGKLWKIKEF